MALLTDELICKAKSVDLKEFLEREEGFTFVKESRDYYRCKEHSSLILKHKNDILTYCWTSKSQKGDIIQYVKENITSNNFREAVKYLTSGENLKVTYRFKDTVKSIEQEKGEIDIEYANNIKRTYAYLTKTRGIKSNLINELLSKKLIGQDQRNNLVFKFLNKAGKVVGGELVGTNTFKRFKSVVSGSDESYGFTIKCGNKIETMIVFEASIDLLSYYQINYGGLRNTLLLGLGGAEKFRKVDTYIKQNIDVNTIIVCTDNDTCGDKAFTNIKNRYSNFNVQDGRTLLKSTGVKDFNELLLLKNL